MNSPTRRILVVNGKGGCGKTTIATNLAVAYACQGANVALLDNDPQASSSHWASLRDKELPAVSLVAKHERPNMYETQSFHHRLPAQTDLVIVDGHSNVRGGDLESLLRQTDVVLVPMLPSSIDIRAGGRFIAELLTHRLYRAAPRPVGVIANRIQPNTQTHNKLMHFLGCLDVPVVAQFRDSPVYTDAVEAGLGVVDMREVRAARKEAMQWKNLVSWIDAQGIEQAATTATIRMKMKPRAASRKLAADSANQA